MNHNPQLQHWHKLARLQARIEQLRTMQAEQALDERCQAELLAIEQLQAKLERIESQTVTL